MSWNEWTNLENSKGVVNLPSYLGPGIYKIRIVNKFQEPYQIPRILTIFDLDGDKEGLFMIGESTTIQTRIKTFFRVLQGKANNHVEGKKLRKIIANLGPKYNKEEYILQYTFKEMHVTEDLLKIEEGKLLQEYFNQFGELPPLNADMPGEK
jgi:hypothetical protein